VVVDLAGAAVVSAAAVSVDLVAEAAAAAAPVEAGNIIFLETIIQIRSFNVASKASLRNFFICKSVSRKTLSKWQFGKLLST
jgi:hypothetical protein